MAHMSTTERSAQFVEAAVRVIAGQGVAKATTRRIAEEAGAPLASLHYCFRDKDGLFHAVFEHLAAISVEPFISVEPTDLEATAELFMQNSIDWMFSHRDYALAQLDLHLWMSRNRPELATELAGGYLSAVAEVLRRADSTLTVDAAATLASVLSGAVDGLVVQWAADRDDTHARAYIDLVCAAVPALCRQARNPAFAIR